MSGPSAAHHAGSRPARGEDDDNPIRLSLLILAGYLALGLVALVPWCVRTGSWGPLAAHVVAMMTALVALRTQGTRTSTFRDWTPLALGPFLYIELRWIIVAVGRPHSDALVAGWETSLFGSDLSHTLAPRWPSLMVSELLHLCYVSYYALVYVPPALLWLRGRRREFAETVLALVVVYAVCFVVYAIFPVDGPRFTLGPSMAPDGPVRSFVLRLLESGSSRGTAFPSSHVAASVVAALCALRFQRRVGIVVAVLAAGLAVGAVYGGYHYGVDVVAGAAVGIAAFLGARRLTSGGAEKPRS